MGAVKQLWICLCSAASQVADVQSTLCSFRRSRAIECHSSSARQRAEMFSSQPELSMVPGRCLIEWDVSWCYIFCAAGFEGRNRPRLLVASSAWDYKGRALVGLVCVMMAPR
jgi:hypothetical protein